MVFEKENLSVSIINFTSHDQENVVRRHRNGRKFSSISYRFHADTELITEKSTLHVGDHSVCFVPAKVRYNRIVKKDKLLAINFHIKGYTAEDIECFLPKNPDKLERLFQKAYECWTKQETGYYHRCVAYFYEILSECQRQNAEDVPSESKIQASVNYIHANYTDPELSLQEIASKSFMSEVYFRKLFKAEYGSSPQKYIIKLRMQKAIELIQTAEYSLKEVAAECGYTDYKYFSAEFKRLLGVSPSEY